MGIHIGLGLPDAAYKGIPEWRAINNNPLLLEEVLVKHPNLRVYVMHAGWPMLSEMIHLLHCYSQVYVDTGAIDWFIPRKAFHFYLERIIETGFGDRVMFGSDEMVWPKAIPIAIESINSATFLTNEQKRDILYNNASRFLRLNE